MKDIPTQAEAPGSTGSKNKIKDILKLVLFLGIGFFFIYWFLLKLDPEQKAAIWDSFVTADYFWVAVAMLCCLLSHFVRALRWQLLFGPLDCTPRLNNIFGSVVVAYMANLAFPRLGEVVRCATLRTSDNIPMEKSLGTVVVERTIDLLAFGIILVAGLLVMFGKAKDWLYDGLSQKFESLPNMGMILSACVILAIAALLAYKFIYPKLLRFAFFQKVDKFIKGGIDGLKSIFKLKPRAVVLFILYSVAIYLLYILGGLIIFQAFPETAWLGMRAAFVLYLFGSVGMTISQGGLGAYPVLVWQALAIYGVADAVGMAAGWLLWSSQQAIVIVVGLIYTIHFSLGKKKSESIKSSI